jgi:hypothetical protein
LKAVAVPPEDARLILILYDDSAPADPKVIQWVVNYLTKPLVKSTHHHKPEQPNLGPDGWSFRELADAVVGNA